MAFDAEALREALRRVPSLPRPEISDQSQASLARAVVLAAAPPGARQAVPDAALVDFARRDAAADAVARDPWRTLPATASAAVLSRARAVAAAAPAHAADPSSSAAPPPVHATVPDPDPFADWRGRPEPPELPSVRSTAPDHPAGPAPYGATAAGTLAGMAAAFRFMHGNGLGRPLDPGALGGLAATIETFDRLAAEAPPIDPDDYGRLLQWAGLARQASFLRTRLGVDVGDPDQHPAFARALQDRADWLAERPPWSGREAACDGLVRWLPLVDCADALGLPTNGRGALHDLGRAVRETAGAALPALRDKVRTARSLAMLDATACLQDSLGCDPGSPAAAARLRATAHALEGLPAAPVADPAGALDRSCLGRLRGVDRSQASELRLEELGAAESPLIVSGLPVLAALDAARRCQARRVVWRRQAEPW